MTIRFSAPAPAPAPSLAYTVGIEGNVRWRQLSACTLTYDDNEPELIEVWVAEKPRTAVIEVTKPDYEAGSRFIPVFN